MWAFDVDDRTFLVEARVEAVQPRFDLYEITPRHYRELGTGFKGRYDSINGFVGILLPLELIGARSGSRVSGATSYREEDANTHVHLGTTTIAVDVLDTTKNVHDPLNSLINHRGYGHHSAAALISMIYLCCGGITVQLPTEGEENNICSSF